MKDNRKVFNVIDPETGEIIRDIRKGDKIIEQKLYENWVSIHGKDVASKGFVALNMGTYFKTSETSLEILHNMNLATLEKNIVELFQMKLHWNSNLVAHKNKKPIQMSEIAKRENVKEESVEKALRSLRQKGVIFVGTTGGSKKTFFNPYLFLKGNYVSDTLREMFVNTEFHKKWEMEQCKK